MTDEKVDRIVHSALRLGMEDGIRLAHKVLERFPEAKKRHMFIAGGAALSSAVLIGAAVAIARRVRAGQTPEQAADEITEEELEGLHLLERRRRPAPSSDGASEESEAPAGEAHVDARADDVAGTGGA